ncbi:MAG: hypothetical protein M5U34_01620 [Chloroflexi bacterium]|nr:hypothetical protein [Chloroflexota bacterium]
MDVALVEDLVRLTTEYTQYQTVHTDEQKRPGSWLKPILSNITMPAPLW